MLRRMLREMLRLVASFGASAVASRAANVSGQSKPARAGRMKTSHFEERIAFGAVERVQGHDESTQREPATFDNDLGGAWLVPPADCA
jgi:hypothetical protein